MNIIILITLILIAFILTIYIVKIEIQKNEDFKELMKLLRKREKEILEGKNLIRKYIEEKSDF